MSARDLTGKICPYAVVEIIRVIDRMEPGETAEFVVDDPLALKSVPEELSEYDDLSCTTAERGRDWIITVTRSI